MESPLHEVGNYIADKVRYLRYKSLLKIINKANKEAKLQGLSLQMPPLKFFVPFCEAASLEDEGDDDDSLTDLQSMWKKLLLDAVTNFDSRHQVFTRIIREITRNEVDFLRRMIEAPRATIQYGPSSHNYVDACWFDESFIATFAKRVRGLEDRAISKMVVDCFETPGVLLYAVDTAEGKAGETLSETSYVFQGSWYHSPERMASHSLLESLGIIQSFRLPGTLYDLGRHIGAEGVRLTQLGSGFIEKCTDLGGDFRFKQRLEITADHVTTCTPYDQ